MEFLQGIGVSPGVAIGPVFILGREEAVVVNRRIAIEEASREISRFRDALEKTGTDVESIRAASLKKLNPKYAAIFDAHIAILRDPVLNREIEGFIKERLVVAEHAVSRVFRKYIATLEQIDQEYLSQRADDLRDLEKRVIGHLAGVRKMGFENITTPVILISRFLTPTETAGFTRDKILGIATDMGGLTSHASIIARALEIPAVVGLKTISNHVSSGDMVIVDGFRGRTIISPDESTREQYRLIQRDYIYTRYIAELSRNEPCVTLDDVKVNVMANVDRCEDIPTAVTNGASGIGLFRTEYLYVNRNALPTEEEQYLAYRKALDESNGLPVTFRTFDIGADKMPPGMMKREEENPALGIRAIRLARVMQDMFRTQLRALLSATADWAVTRDHKEAERVRIMFPMISHSSEFLWAKLQIKSVRDELAEKGVSVPRNVQVGAMLEVPGIFLSADHLIARADFLSVGTNDLIQYLFAVDRTNEDVSYLYTPLNQSVFNALKILLDSMSKISSSKRPALSVCGEMASDPVSLVLLLGLGIRDISVSTRSVPLIKHVIRSIRIENCVEITSRALAQSRPEIDTAPARAYLNETMSDLLLGGR